MIVNCFIENFQENTLAKSRAKFHNLPAQQPSNSTTFANIPPYCTECGSIQKIVKVFVKILQRVVTAMERNVMTAEHALRDRMTQKRYHFQIWKNWFCF